MGKCNPSFKKLARSLQGIPHVAEEEKLRRGNAVGMRRDPTFTDIDLAIGKELAQMVVGSAVTKSQLEHVPIQVPDEVGSQVEAGALSLQASDKAVEPAQDDQAAKPA